jgi:hypothetical protein
MRRALVPIAILAAGGLGGRAVCHLLRVRRGCGGETEAQPLR